MNDLISRQQAIDALNEQIEQCNKALGSFDISLKDEYAIKVERASLEAYKEQLENMPSIQPERKKGEWINRGRIIRCSKCKIGYATAKGVKSALTYNFCPNCGAKMDGGEHK